MKSETEAVPLKKKKIHSSRTDVHKLPRIVSSGKEGYSVPLAGRNSKHPSVIYNPKDVLRHSSKIRLNSDIERSAPKWMNKP